MNFKLTNVSTWHCIIATGAISGMLFVGAMPASAGQCPANKVVADGKGQKMGATQPKGLGDRVLTRINLINEPVMLKEHALRLRRLVIQPGGIVPWHSHTDRPAIIYIISGTITEYRSTCAVPIVHRAGESTAEVKGTSHWRRNTGRRTDGLLPADSFHDEGDAHVM